MGNTYLIYTLTYSLTLWRCSWQQLLRTVFHSSLRSSCLNSDCLNTKPCHFCPVPSVFLSIHSVPPDQQQGQCGHQHQRACPHSFSGTLSACLAACMLAWVSVSLSNYLYVSTFSEICPDYAAVFNSSPFSLCRCWLFWGSFVVFFTELKNRKCFFVFA